jgi:hypothetical protein
LNGQSSLDFGHSSYQGLQLDGCRYLVRTAVSATIKRTLVFITLSATRVFSLFLVLSQTGGGFGLLPGINLVS